MPLRAIREAKIGQPMAFAARVAQMHVVPMSSRGYRLEAVVDDSDFAQTRRIPAASARLVFFSYKKQYVNWLSMRLHSGANVVVAGDPTEYNGQLQFTHPEVLTVDPDPDTFSTVRYDATTAMEALRHICRPRPVYHANSRISSDHIHESILGLLDALCDVEPSGDVSTTPLSTTPSSYTANNEAEYSIDDQLLGEEHIHKLRVAIPDILPEDILDARSLMHRADAFMAIHNPQSTEDFHQAIATLRYEEAFVSQISVLQSRELSKQSDAYPCEDTQLRDMFIASLPFVLTDGQQTVIDGIAADMAQEYPMQRLLQGEVGSGKTVVAIAAMLQAVGAGYQTVLVAPTQVLAEQHMQTISSMVNTQSMHVPVTLLTGGMKLAARRKALAQAASGEPGIIIATHAAFSKTFQSPNLALVVIDEQHRFGVEQREILRKRGEKTPHLLVMTATPIPRTAAMTWFGDLDISWLTELPGGRKPIRTIVVQEADGSTMANMFAHIRARVDAGERAYIVCPRIDDDDHDDMNDEQGENSEGFEAFHESDGGAGATQDSNADGDANVERPPLHSVHEIADRLSTLPQFAGMHLATLTGRDDDATKKQVMERFSDGEQPILVATTVIEVGVDVPQASCIVIFDADRFGLSQLHQLRGRVGRGGTDSWAFLVSRAQPDSLAAQRLEVIHHSLDGAQIAQADLELRGAGDVLGDAQSGGKSSLKLLRVVKDAELIADARGRAETLLKANPDLSGEVQLVGAVLDFTRGGEAQIVSS